jgi:hypothetical protein
MAGNLGDLTTDSTSWSVMAQPGQVRLSQSVQAMAESDANKAAPTGDWDKFVDVTKEGVQNIPSGIAHAFENPMGLVENAAFSVALGTAAKVLLPERGPLGTVFALGLGAYFLEQAAVPIYQSYKTGLNAKTMGDIHGAGQQLGDALGGTAVNLPIGIAGYNFGAGTLGEGIMGLPSMRGFAEAKAARLDPISDAMSARLGRLFGRNAADTAPGGVKTGTDGAPLQGHVETTEVAKATDGAVVQGPALPTEYLPIKEKFAGTTVPGISRQFLKNLQVDSEGTYYGAGLRYPDIMADPAMKAYIEAHNARTMAAVDQGVYNAELANEAQTGGAFGKLPDGWEAKSAPASAIDVTDGGDGSMNVGGKTYTLTDDGAPNRKLTVSSGFGGSKDFIAESPDFEMQQVVATSVNGADKFAVVGSQHGASVLHVYDANGALEQQIQLPGYGLLHDVKAGETPSQVQFLYDTPISPPQVLTLDTAGNTAQFTPLPGYEFNTGDYVTQKVLVPWTDINGKPQTAPAFVSYPKDMPMNGQNPAMFEIYGGFDVGPQYDRFMANSASWLKRGGVSVDPVLPGDGGLGSANYQEGLLAGIHNNALAMAAIIEKLHEMGITSPEKTGIYGRSNGGMMVNHLLNSRPELFGAAVTESGVNSLFDSPVINPDTGKYWEPEFGNPKDPAQVAWMSKLDVLNNVSPTVKYPPTLVEIGTVDGVVNAGNGISYANMRLGLPNNGETLLYSRIGEGHDPTSLALQTAFLWDRLNPQAKTN